MWIRNPGWKNSDPGWKKFGSGINILDPQHCVQLSSRSNIWYFLICTVRYLGTVSYSSHVKTKKNL